jgi:hypothetical protein
VDGEVIHDALASVLSRHLNGRICRENVWIDGAAAMAQLLAP